MHGKVKFFNETRGFGFICLTDEESKGYFVTAKGLLEPIRSDDVVSFEVIMEKNELHAYNVKVLERNVIENIETLIEESFIVKEEVKSLHI